MWVCVSLHLFYLERHQVVVCSVKAVGYVRSARLYDSTRHHYACTRVGKCATNKILSCLMRVWLSFKNPLLSLLCCQCDEGTWPHTHTHTHRHVSTCVKTYHVTLHTAYNVVQLCTCIASTGWAKKGTPGNNPKAVVCSQ